jgi:hypothetical protein
MASLLYDSLADDVSKGNVVANADSFKAMLVTSAYTPNKGTHAKRSDVTNEVAAGGGYTAGGTVVTVTVAKDTVNHKETWTFSNPSWAAATITAHALVIYKSRGGLASADELVAYVDFGADVASTGGTFSVTFSTPLTIQN